MRTTLDLDDRIVEALQARYPDLTRTEAVERAVASHLQADATAGLLAIAGSLEIEDVSAQLRAVDRLA